MKNRLAKDAIPSIKKACKLTDAAFKFILKKIKPGISEKEIAFEINDFIKKHGADIAFPSIVAFDKNSVEIHHKPTDQRLKTKDIILMDFGAKVENYCSDMTRTIFLGKATSEQKKIYQTVLEAQKRAMKQLNNGIKASSVDKIARDYIVSQGYPTIPHSLGHGVGLEVHESPRLSPTSNDILKPGMVFSIEPGIYLPNKFGVRIEDLVALEQDGIKILTHSTKALIEL